MATSTTATQHYGEGFDPSIYTLESLQKAGRCCQGKYSTDNEWYGLLKENGAKYPYRSFMFCKYCAENCIKGRVYKVSPEEVESYGQIDCSMAVNLTPFGIDRIIKDPTELFGVNVNLVDPKDKEVYAPAPILIGEKGLRAAAVGAAIVPIPSGCYIEIVLRCIRPNPDHCYIVKAKTGTGRILSFLDSFGRKYYTDSRNTFTIDSFVKGKAGTRIFYTAASQLEKAEGIDAEHEDLSNKFFITIERYRKEKVKTYYEEEGDIYRSGGANRSVSKTRSAKAPVMRGGSSIRGGATYDAAGHNEFAKTVLTKDKFVHISTHELTVQLVNTETEEVLVGEAQKIQQQVDEAHERELEQLRQELEKKKREGDTRRGSILKGHAAQSAALI